VKIRILLTGATGNVGFETLKELVKQKERYEINILDIKSYKNIRLLKRFKKDINIFWGDIRYYPVVLKAVKNSDFIIHTAALIPPAADKNPETAEEINAGGTYNICKAINETDSEKFLLFTSSISVYGDRTENPEIRTSDKLNPSKGDFYALTKIKAENIVKTELGNFSIFRLSAVVHPNMKLDPLFFHMPLNTSLEVITASDTARALVKSAEKKEYLNEIIFNLGGGEKCRISYNDFLKENFKILGLKQLNFPEHAFAEKNFHCGFYADGYILNDILDFRRDTLDDYFDSVRKNVNPVKYAVTKAFSSIIKKRLLRFSEPYKAFKRQDYKNINRFFKTSDIQNAL